MLAAQFLKAQFLLLQRLGFLAELRQAILRRLHPFFEIAAPVEGVRRQDQLISLLVGIVHMKGFFPRRRAFRRSGAAGGRRMHDEKKDS